MRFYTSCTFSKHPLQAPHTYMNVVIYTYIRTNTHTYTYMCVWDSVYAYVYVKEILNPISICINSCISTNEDIFNAILDRCNKALIPGYFNNIVICCQQGIEFFNQREKYDPISLTVCQERHNVRSEPVLLFNQQTKSQTQQTS